MTLARSILLKLAALALILLMPGPAVLENFRERDEPICPTGQIELLNHGSNLCFKNIYIRELK